ncbi:MAG TPA: NADH-quinone oxidoreductase subunit N [Gemmatimonadaceae bacterium]|nr:NADH-quinone oxidoreductase subunit N [Gemmatimonadaceae bacterium]
MALDLSDPRQLAVALGPDLILLGGAMLLLIWAAWRPDGAAHQRRVGIACLVLTALTAAAVVWSISRDQTTLELGVVAVDGLRWLAALVLLLGTGLTIAMAVDYNAREGIGAAESHVLILLGTAGMLLLAAARDMILVFLGIELLSICVYALSAMNRRSIRSAEGALKYFLLGAFATAFLLYGMALVYGATGETNIALIGARITELGLAANPLLLTGIALLLIGFAFKIAAVPFHMWAPDVYEGAPTPVTAYMAASVKAAAFVAFLRVWAEAFPEAFDVWQGVIVALAVVTMFAGNLIALAQRNIKRLLAYSSIAHAGYLLVAFATATVAGVEALLFYLFAYTLATMGAFAVLVAAGTPGEPNQRVEDYSGLWGERPWLAAAMTVFMMALLGFPVFGGIGFFAKWYVIRAALEAPTPLIALAIILVVTSVISAGYYLHVVMVMFMKPRPVDAPPIGPSRWLTRAVIVATAVLIIAFGMYPQPLLDAARIGAPAVVRVGAASTAGPGAGFGPLAP